MHEPTNTVAFSYKMDAGHQTSHHIFISVGPWLGRYVVGTDT